MSRGSAPFARGWRRGYLDLADKGTLVLDHVEDLTPRVQELLIKFLRTSTFTRVGGAEARTSKVRIISTTTRDLDMMVGQGKFSAELLELLRVRTISILPLRARKEDIPAYAQEFLTRYKKRNREQMSRFSRGAMKALVGHRWPLNFAELNTVISQAVAAAQGKTIEEEHIFFDIRPSMQPVSRINLMKVKGIGPFLKNTFAPAAFQYVTVPLFLILVLYTLFGPRDHNLGNIVAWALLWPFLLLSLLVTGRGFCAYCPISAASSALTWDRKKFLSFPGWMKQYGIWIGMAAFVAIFWVEHVTEAFLNARVTGIVFLSISGSALITTTLFGKRIWCLHICPLGRMMADLAVLSVMELRGNSKVCVWQCETRACLKEHICPMGLHPSTERTRHDCVLCFACAKKCKQRSVHLDVLLPHQRVMAMKSWNLSRTAFVVLLTGSVLASQVLRWLGEPRVFASFNLPVIHFDSNWSYFLAGIALTAAYGGLTCLASKTRGFLAWGRDFIFAGYAYLPIAFFGLFDVYFGQFILRGGEIPVILGKLLEITGVAGLAGDGSVLAPLQNLRPFLVLVGGLLSLYLLRKLRGQYRLHSISYRWHQLLIVATSAVFIIIF